MVSLDQISDSERQTRILLYGVITAYIVTYLDGIGINYGLWAYNYMVLPLFNRFMCVDLSALPVMNMVIYQYYRSWKSYMLATLFVALGYAFILEPFSVWIHVYVMYKWAHIYSLPIYIAIACFTKWFVDIIANRMKQESDSR